MQTTYRYFILAILAALVVASVPAWAADLVLFRGDAGSRAGYTVGGWGSGTCEESREIVYTGEVSLKFTTRNLYTGMRIDFANPVDVSGMAASPQSYIRFTVRSTTPGTGEGGTPAAGPGGKGPGLIGQSGSGKGSGGGGTSQFVEPVFLLPQNYVSPITEIRTILFFDKGAVSVDSEPVELYRVDGEGWVSCWVPLKGFGIDPELAASGLERIVLCGNARDTLYLGDARIVIDDQPIHAVGGDKYVVPVNSLVWLQAKADGGAAALSYSWDFDASDGITEDATGFIVSHKYSASGEYTVTLTVSDSNGIKKPVTVTYTVEATV
jgi:hypothetical protein